MISGQLDLQRHDSCIVLSPNLSARWQSTKIFLFIVSLFALSIAVAFALVGLWMILSFAGIEIIVMLILMYRVARQCYRKEVIHISPQKIRVEQGISQPHSVWESELFWARLIVQPPGHVWHAPKLYYEAGMSKLRLVAF